MNPDQKVPEQAIEHLQLGAGVIQVANYGDMDASTLHRLESLMLLAEELDNQIKQEVSMAQNLNHSWAEIGQALEMSRQAAWAKYADRKIS